MLTIILFNMDDHFYDQFYNVHKAVESGVRPRAVCTAHEELAYYTSKPVQLHRVYIPFIGTLTAPNAKYQQQLPSLIRLRMNYLLKDLAYQLHVSGATVQNAFQCILDVLYSKL